MSTSISATSFWLYALGYLTQAPSYLCTYKSQIIQACTAANICSGDETIESSEVDYSNPISLHNWMERLSLKCEPQWKINLMVTIYFVGWCTTILWLPLISDYFGRRRFLKIGNFLNLIFYTVLLASKDVNITLAAIFFCGALAASRLTIGVPYLMELLPKERRNLAFTLCAMFDISIYLLSTVYFWKISNRWIYFVGIGYILQMFASIAVWFLPESPKLLV